MRRTFRFDDVSINTNVYELVKTIGAILSFDETATILLGLSPIVFSTSQLARPEHYERVHPRMLTAGSSVSAYSRGDRCGLPYDLIGKLSDQFPDARILFAGHGLAHVDHRLLSFDAQEMSIVMSASLAEGVNKKRGLWESYFIPPYNKWNENTERICQIHKISLIRFEDGWLHVAHNTFDPSCVLYYMHPYDLKAGELTRWFGAGLAAAGAVEWKI